MRLLVLATLPCLLAAQETHTTTRDQQSLAVTIYNNNLALVKDLREVKLPKGEASLAFQEVSGQIRPERISRAWNCCSFVWAAARMCSHSATP